MSTSFLPCLPQDLLCRAKLEGAVQLGPSPPFYRISSDSKPLTPDLLLDFLGGVQPVLKEKTGFFGGRWRRGPKGVKREKCPEIASWEKLLVGNTLPWQKDLFLWDRKVRGLRSGFPTRVRTQRPGAATATRYCNHHGKEETLAGLLSSSKQLHMAMLWLSRCPSWVTRVIEKGLGVETEQRVDRAGRSWGTCKWKVPNEDLMEGMGCGQDYRDLRGEAYPRGRPPARYLLAVSIAEGQAKVVLLQEVEVLTDQVKQHLAPAMLLKERAERQ